MIRKTVSFCSTCYKEIPAYITIRSDGVYLVKTCSEHGGEEALIERSPEYYTLCMRASATNIYNGYFMDVTQRCNLKCKFCYHSIDKSKDPSIRALVDEAVVNAWRAPIILHGGEPSLRKDLPFLIRELEMVASGVEVLTNGTGIDLDQIGPLVRNPNGVLRINLSMHPESNGKDFALLDKVASTGDKLESLLFVIDDVSQIDEIVRIGNTYKHVVEAIRIKAATRLWAEQKPDNKIFVSDMLDYMQKYVPQTMWWRNNKTSFFNIEIDGMCYMLVSWYDIHNVDLIDIACPPYYRSRSGRIDNIVTACLINEGMSKGWLNGNRIGE